MEVFHFSAECYPAAKTGGLGDVVGTLPKYLNEFINATVILPKYQMPWFQQQSYKETYKGKFALGSQSISYKVEKVNNDPLGFPMYVLDIPGKFDRYGVYAGEDGVFFNDEVERYIAFARAACLWMEELKAKPSIVHCHDHHMGLILFYLKYGYDYPNLRKIKSVFTIHNERYQGSFGWDKQYLLGNFDPWKSGMLDWGHRINPLAAAIKCADKVTTVSPTYMDELMNESSGLEWLFNHESEKCIGILNGIDNTYWNPTTDDLIEFPLKRSIAKYKKENKEELLKDTPLNAALPLISFIGRFALEKGVDLIPRFIESILEEGKDVNFVILGTGDKAMESQLMSLGDTYPDHVACYIMYNEKFAHQIYAGSDYLMMPSRVEPCGLNQMFSLRYGTIPIVHNIGGLKDSIDTLQESEGSGIKMESLNHDEFAKAINSALELYSDSNRLDAVRKRIMKIDNSWEKSASAYIDIYKSLTNK